MTRTAWHSAVSASIPTTPRALTKAQTSLSLKRVPFMTAADATPADPRSSTAPVATTTVLRRSIFRIFPVLFRGEPAREQITGG